MQWICFDRCKPFKKGEENVEIGKNKVSHLRVFQSKKKSKKHK